MVAIITTSKDHDASHGDVVVNDRDSSCQVEVVVVREIVLQANVAVFLGRHVQTRQTDIQSVSTCTICITTYYYYHKIDYELIIRLTPLSLYINFFWVTWLFCGMVTFVGETGTF